MKIKTLLLIILFELLSFFVCLNIYRIPLFVLLALIIPFVLLFIDLIKFIKSHKTVHLNFITFNRVLGFILVILYFIIWYFFNKNTPGIYNNIYSQIGILVKKTIINQTLLFIVIGFLSFLGFLMMIMIPISGIMIISFPELFYPSNIIKNKHKNDILSIVAGILLIVFGSFLTVTLL